MITRPTESTEYNEIINLMISGFNLEGETPFFPKRETALALQLEASLGLRIGDVLDLRVSSFKNGKLETIERKTGKLQYREVSPEVINKVQYYALENGLSPTDKIFDIKVRAVQTQLKRVSEYLGLSNVSTHSFRKMYANTIYRDNNNDVYLVKEILKHSSIATTEQYLNARQQDIDRASAKVCYMV